VAFTDTIGTANPAPKTVQVTNSGGSLTGLGVDPIGYGTGASGWLTAALSATTAPATLTLAANLSGLAAGTYTATVPVTSAVASNSPQWVEVAFTVVPAAPPPPAPPTDLTARVLSSNQINVAWTDRSNNEDGFRIERCAGKTCTNFALRGTVGPNETSFPDVGIASNVVYRYWVQAYNTGGNSYTDIASAGVFGLTPSADAATFGYIPGTNFGSSTLLAIENRSVENYYAASLVRFDLSSLPVDAVIQDAYLELYCSNKLGNPLIRIGRLSSSTAWTEAGVTWNNMPYGETPPSFKYFSISAGSYNLYPVTEFVQRWVGGIDTNSGFQLFTDTDGTNAAFSAREAGSNVRPKLTFTFYTP
jgi:hypothetical protein